MSDLDALDREYVVGVCVRLMTREVADLNALLREALADGIVPTECVLDRDRFETKLRAALTRP